MVTAAELSYNTSASAIQMANAIFGNGVQVVGATYTGASYSSAIYSGGSTLAPGVTPGNTGVILSTGIASSFTNSFGDSNQSGSTSYNTSGPNGISNFNTIAGTSTYDASYLDVSFIPTGNVMTIQFVFSSDEYPEYSDSIYNDAVGVWANGVHVPLSVTGQATQVGGVNQNENINLYHDNTNDQYNTEMDGFTVKLTLTIPVNAGVVNTIRIGIADTSDSSYDSNLLIGGDSIQTTLVALDDSLTLKEGQTGNINVLANDLNATGGTLVVTHINGNAVTVGSSITLPTGQVVTLMPDGTFNVTTDTDNDKIAFTYEVKSVNAAGATLQTDVGFVQVETIPCFVAGTLIRTEFGDVPVETLRPGDLVQTLDDGLQPLRWIGQRAVPAVGKMAPIRIKAGAYGMHDTLLLSPQHRVLVRDIMTNLFFGESEVLVRACDLVNGTSVRRIEGGEVTYVHILFDRHQVVWSNGLATESFLPGPQTTDILEQDIVNEICALFPELDPRTGKGYSPSARRTLRRYEAQLLMGLAA